MIRAVRSYEGYVVQSTGDGIYAVFGAPIAYEDHPQRGVYAALEMQKKLREHTDRLAKLGKPTIEVRIGINSGELVMRAVETGEGSSTPRSGIRPISLPGCRPWPPTVRLP